MQRIRTLSRLLPYHTYTYTYISIRVLQIVHIIEHNRTRLKGVPKKTSLKLRRSFCLISLATNMLEGWDIIYLKGEIHSFVSSTKSFLYDIRELRYKLNSIRFKKSWIMINPISLNLILRRFMYKFSRYEHCRGLRHVSF